MSKQKTIKVQKENGAKILKKSKTRKNSKSPLNLHKKVSIKDSSQLKTKNYFEMLKKIDHMNKRRISNI